MWLTCSSVGRKFIMALTGACLVLFVTFHCVMNAVAIFWPTAYNAICQFLGANWYALIASAGLAALFIIHIIYATWLTIQNRRARGNQRYAISKLPAGVEWSSKNMYVLGIVVLAFLVVHMIQFWAKMQLREIMGAEGLIPASAGTLFIQEAFSCVWTPIVYIIGFVALWFHFNHGFWSMFQTCGWSNQVWINRLKKIAMWWSSIVVALFIVQALVFTLKSNEDFYKTDVALQDQYAGMAISEFGLGNSMQGIKFADLSTFTHQICTIQAKDIDDYHDMGQIPFDSKQVASLVEFIKYIEGEDSFDNMPIMPQMQQQMQEPQAPEQRPEEAQAPAPAPEEESAPANQNGVNN